MASTPPLSRPPMFWGEMSPCEHAVQIYADDDFFLDALDSFVGAGVAAGEAAIVIATPGHLARLETRLEARMDLSAARLEHRYLGIPAERVLRDFMVGGWPDEARFVEVVTTLLERVRGDERRRVRAFGEMVALLWAQGYPAATVRLEHLWSKLARREGFPLFCAYPKAGFTSDPTSSLRELCAAHSRVFFG